MHIQTDKRTIPKVSGQIDVISKALVKLGSFWNYKNFDFEKCNFQENYLQLFTEIWKKMIFAVAMATEEAK